MKNIYKKIIILTCLSFLLISVFIPIHVTLSEKITPQLNYQLLAPLPCTNGTPGCVNGKLTTFNPNATTDPHALGTYLNITIKIVIGLCGVLAVVMIVVGGIEYSTSELISSKEAGKERIRGAIFGLVLALGAYTLLFQINPNLLNTDVDITQAILTVNLQEDVEILTGPAVPYSGPLPSGSVASCTGGIVRTHNIPVCQAIAQNLDNMINAARDAGLTLTGGGYRTEKEQIAKRIANCGGNLYDSNHPCQPPTAAVGHSRHESGLAIDFNCNGKLIPQYATAESNSCFAWLQANAAKYGFYNLKVQNPQKREGWHWSFDGK